MTGLRQVSIAGLWLVVFALVAVSVGSEGKAPDFALPNIDGKDVKLADLLARGPVVIDFWATWCKPCIKGFPALQQMHDKYKERGVTVVAISVDSPKSRSRVSPFIKSQKYTFEVLLDADGKVAQKYSAVAIPRTVVVNREGAIVYTSVGYRPTNEERLEEAILALLPPQASGAPGDSGEGAVGK